MAKKLSEAEIKHRLVRLSNLERLYTDQLVTVKELRAENAQLKVQISELTAKFERIVETQAARITELETMVFGRKPPRGGSSSSVAPKRPKIVRSRSSYFREVPSKNEITSEERHSIHSCHHCGNALIDKQEHIRYEEDIALAVLDPRARSKTCVRKTIERGWCVRCGQFSSAIDLRGSTVVLGPKVRSLVVYLLTILDNSYDQTVRLLWDLYHFKLANGEITVIVDSRRLEFLPGYEKLKDTIRDGPAVHMDETRYPIQSEKQSGHAWSMSSVNNTDIVFKLADNRGKGNAIDLVGKNYTGIGVTDRYGAYKNLFVEGRHQICWAHLQRNAKDLTHLECLPKNKQKHVKAYYNNLLDCQKIPSRTIQPKN